MEAVTITQITPPELEALITRIVSKAIQQQPEKEDLLTVRDAADLLGLQVPTIYSKVCRGELPGMRLGKRVYFSRRELMDYLQAGKKAAYKSVDYCNSKKTGGAL